MQVRDLLELLRTLARDRVATHPPDEEHRLRIGNDIGNRTDLGLAIEDLAHLIGDAFQPGKDACPVGVREVANTSEQHGKHREADTHVRQHLGRGDAHLGAGMQVDATAAGARDRRADDIHQADHVATLALDLLHGEQRVGGLARLTHRDVERVGLDDRVAVAELGRRFGVGWDSREVFDQRCPQLADVVGRPAPDGLHPFERSQVTRVEAQTVEAHRREPMVEASGEHAPQRLRLLEHLLVHERGVLADLSRDRLGVDRLRLLARVGRLGGEGAKAVSRDDGALTVVEVHHAGRVPHDRRRVGGNEHLVITDPEHERGALAGHDDAVGPGGIDDRDGEGAADLGEGIEHLLLEGRRLRPGDQVRESFGVGVARELDALSHQTCAQLCSVVDDAVVHQQNPTVVRLVRVGIGLRGRPVGGPAGVPDADRRRQPLGQLRLEVAHSPHGAHDLRPARGEHTETGGVVAAVFELGEAFDDDGHRLVGADIAHDSAHSCVPFSRRRCAAAGARSVRGRRTGRAVVRRR